MNDSKKSIYIIRFISTALCFISFCSTQAQPTINGSISNYQINCNDGSSCTDVSTASNARYYYVAPTDGRLAITGFAAGGLINCCDNSYQMVCNGGFRKLKAPANIHNFTTSTTTGFLDCIAEGDSIELNFNGSFGTYGYVATVISDPLPNDAEPNNRFYQAIDIQDGLSYTGHLWYGAYKLDNVDRYRFIADQIGTLNLRFAQDVALSISTFRNDSLFVGGEQINSNPYVFSVDCLAEGDTVFLSLSTVVGCMNYDFNATFEEPVFGLDIEPNNSQAEAIASSDIYGTIGHGRNKPVQPDASDYFELPYLMQSDELTFEIEVIGGPLLFRLRSERFSGFSLSLGFATDETITHTFQPTFDDTFYLEAFASTGNCGDYKVNLSGCVKELYLTGPESRTMDMESDSFIVSTQALILDALVDYDAKHFVSLESGFQVDVGAVFHAFIDGCDP